MHVFCSNSAIDSVLITLITYLNSNLGDKKSMSASKIVLVQEDAICILKYSSFLVMS